MPIGDAGSGCIWITGASSGIGRTLALRLASRGHVVAASARNADALDDLRALPLAGRIVPFPLDVTDAAEVHQTIVAIEEACGPIHTAVLNAGTYQAMGVARFDAAEAKRQIDVNLVGIINALDPLLRSMRGRRCGHIAMVGSLTSRFGLPQAGVYGATKAALINLGEALRVECKTSRVTIQVISPGFVKTPLTDRNQFPMPFLVPVERAAEIIEKGLATRRFEIAFPWQMTLATGLLRCLPRGLAFAITGQMLRP